MYIQFRLLFKQLFFKPFCNFYIFSSHFTIFQFLPRQHGFLKHWLSSIHTVDIARNGCEPSPIPLRWLCIIINLRYYLIQVVHCGFALTAQMLFGNFTACWWLFGNSTACWCLWFFWLECFRNERSMLRWCWDLGGVVAIFQTVVVAVRHRRPMLVVRLGWLEWLGDDRSRCDWYVLWRLQNLFLVIFVPWSCWVTPETKREWKKKKN